MIKRIVNGALVLVVACTSLESSYAGGRCSIVQWSHHTSDEQLPDWHREDFGQDERSGQPHQDVQHEVGQMVAAVAAGDEPSCGQHGENCGLVDYVLSLYGF